MKQHEPSWVGENLYKYSGEKFVIVFQGWIRKNPMILGVYPREILPHFHQITWMTMFVTSLITMTQITFQSFSFHFYSSSFNSLTFHSIPFFFIFFPQMSISIIYTHTLEYYRAIKIISMHINVIESYNVEQKK